jgi:hypothetical protein
MEVILSLLTLAALGVLIAVMVFRYRETLRENRTALVLTFACAALVPVFLYFFYTPPGWHIGAEQPIAFSHRVHAGVKDIQCRFCHPYVGRSIHPGLPPVEKCLYCHNYIIAAHPEILKEHRYFNTRTPTPWKKVNYLAEHVVFNHQRHIRKNVACGECHGDVEAMDRIKGEYFYMGFCLKCHRERKANIDCWLACHS